MAEKADCKSSSEICRVADQLDSPNKVGQYLCLCVYVHLWVCVCKRWWREIASCLLCSNGLKCQTSCVETHRRLCFTVCPCVVSSKTSVVVRNGFCQNEEVGAFALKEKMAWYWVFELLHGPLSSHTLAWDCWVYLLDLFACVHGIQSIRWVCMTLLYHLRLLMWKAAECGLMKS